MAADAHVEKLEQMFERLDELEYLLAGPCNDFEADWIARRAAERSFQLLVDLAVDVNLHMLVENTAQTPDTYRHSFEELGRIEVLDVPLSALRGRSAELRNFLVHDYDFDSHAATFYRSAKEFLEPHRRYVSAIHRALGR